MRMPARDKVRTLRAQHTGRYFDSRRHGFKKECGKHDIIWTLRFRDVIGCQCSPNHPPISNPNPGFQDLKAATSTSLRLPGAHLASKQEAFEWLTLHQGKHRGNEKCRQSKPRTTLSNRKAIPSPRHGLTIPAPDVLLVLPCLALGQSRIILPPRVVARTLGLHFSNPPHLSAPPPPYSSSSPIYG